MLKQITVIMTQMFLRAVGGLVMAASVALGQAPKPAFEVASVKPAQPIELQDPGKLHIGMQIDGARVDIGSMRLADLIPVAFRVKFYQVSGPDWLSADDMSAPRFDVLGKMPEGAASEQVPEMLQALLAERFKLTFHRESREHSVYALVVAKGGPKLKQLVPEADSLPGGQAGTIRISPGPDGSMRTEASKQSMVQLAELLSRSVDRPILDMTELKGYYHVTLEISMADMKKAARAEGFAAGPPGAGAASAADAASDPSSGSIFSAVQKLGLRLEPRKSLIETIVIDHVEKTPTAN